MATGTVSSKTGIKLNLRVVGGIGLIIAVIVLALGVISARSAPTQTIPTVAVTRGNIMGSVAGSGSVTAEQKLDMAFQASGTVVQVLVKEGDSVTQGQALAKLDDRVLQSQVANAQASLDSARAKLLQSQKGNARPEDIIAAQASITSAQAAYDAAVNSANASSSTLVSLKAAIDKAQITVQQTQAAYDRIGGASNPNIGMMPQSKDLQNASIDYAKAKSDYEAQAKTIVTDSQSKVQSAFTTLQQAKRDLAKLTTPATDTDLAIQQAAVTQAEQALKQAQLNLENATLRSPFAGIVTTVNIIPGSNVNVNTVALTLINRNPLHVNLKLSENDVVQVQPDQPVMLTIDSVRDWKAQGKVSYIAPASETSNGVVTYAVRVSFADDDPRVKVGMTANLTIITAQKENVLLVPNSALLPKGSGHVVEVIGKDGKPSEVDVQTGLSDGTQTEIVSGLSEGMKIVSLPGSTSPQRGGLFGE